MTDTPPEDVTAYVAQLDQQTATVRDLVARVRQHWADDSGCPLPKCPSATLAMLLEVAHPETVRGLLLTALVMLADQPDQPDPPPHTPTPGHVASLPHGYMPGICGDDCNNRQCPAGETHDRCTPACLATQAPTAQEGNRPS